MHLIHTVRIDLGAINLHEEASVKYDIWQVSSPNLNCKVDISNTRSMNGVCFTSVEIDMNLR